MPSPVGTSSLNLVRLSLRGDRNSGWVLGPCVAKVVERMAGNTILKVEIPPFYFLYVLLAYVFHSNHYITAHFFVVFVFFLICFYVYIKVLDVSFNNAGDGLAQALGLVLVTQAGLAADVDAGGLEELNWDGNNTTLEG